MTDLREKAADRPQQIALWVGPAEVEDEGRGAFVGVFATRSGSRIEPSRGGLGALVDRIKRFNPSRLAATYWNRWKEAGLHRLILSTR
jgi:hypothetical protein